MSRCAAEADTQNQPIEQADAFGDGRRLIGRLRKVTLRAQRPVAGVGSCAQ
jgi:hypothetical protein